MLLDPGSFNELEPFITHQGDELGLSAEKYLGEKFVRGYVAVKRAEHENFKRVISSWEREFLLLSV